MVLHLAWDGWRGDDVQRGQIVPCAEGSDSSVYGRGFFVFFYVNVGTMVFVMVFVGPWDVWGRNGGFGLARRLNLARFWRMPWLVR